MKITLAGLLRLTPFEETKADISRARKIYAANQLLAFGVIVSTACLGIGLVAVIMKASFALPLWGAGLGLSAMTAGLEWNAGLRARALNQLSIVLVTVVLVYLTKFL